MHAPRPVAPATAAHGAAHIAVQCGACREALSRATARARGRSSAIARGQVGATGHVGQHRRRRAGRRHADPEDEEARSRSSGAQSIAAPPNQRMSRGSTTAKTIASSRPAKTTRRPEIAQRAASRRGATRRGRRGRARLPATRPSASATAPGRPGCRPARSSPRGGHHGGPAGDHEPDHACRHQGSGPAHRSGRSSRLSAGTRGSSRGMTKWTSQPRLQARCRLHRRLVADERDPEAHRVRTGAERRGRCGGSCTATRPSALLRPDLDVPSRAASPAARRPRREKRCGDSVAFISCSRRRLDVAASTNGPARRGRGRLGAEGARNARLVRRPWRCGEEHAVHEHAGPKVRFHTSAPTIRGQAVLGGVADERRAATSSCPYAVADVDAGGADDAFVLQALADVMPVGQTWTHKVAVDASPRPTAAASTPRARDPRGSPRFAS